jgi:hypothetical protein
LQASQQLVDVALPRPDLTDEMRRLSSAACGMGDADRLFVHVQTDENGSSLWHG